MYPWLNDWRQDPKKFVRVILSLLFATELEMGFDPTVHRIDVQGKTCYVYELTQESGETLYFRTTKTIFNPRTACISGRKTRVWRVIEVTGPDGSRTKGDKEVVLKDVWLDKDSQTEKKTQESIFGTLEDINQDKKKLEKLEWLEVDYRKRVDDALKDIPYSLPFMRILHDAKGVDCKERLEKALPDRAILSPPERLVSSSKNVIPSSTQNDISYSPTGSSHGPQATPNPEGRPQRQYKAKTQYRLVYSKVGYALHDARSIDKAFHAINNVLTGDKMSFIC